jgi:hypothetical protein
MIPAGFLCQLLLVLPAHVQPATDAELHKALHKTIAADSYAFTVNEQAGPPNVVEGKYQKGQPLYCKAEKIECFKKADAVVYREKDEWLRSKTGTVSDPLRVLGAIAKVRTLKVPHEELAVLAKVCKEVKKTAAKEDGLTVYASDLGAEAAKQLARTEHQGVAQGGSARVWVNGEGIVVKYAVSLRLQGRLGNAEIDGTASRTVTLGGLGATKVEVPDAARKALE